MDLIKRTFRLVSEDTKPTTIDQVIEFTDMQRTLVRLPAQYREALDAWHSAEDGDITAIAMELGRDLEDARVTVKSAWSYLYDLMNGDP